MIQSDFIYTHNDQAFKGYLAYHDTGKVERPAVLVVHDWSGRNEFACKKAEMLADLGYVGFAVDMYGDGQQGQTTEEKMALMQPLVNDRRLIKERLMAAYQALLSMPEVDSNHIAAIGFCFGGLCVLDLARSGLNFKGVISFHGLLNKPEALKTEQVKAKILALHGYDDPMVAPEQVNAFCQEMTQAGADWQVHMYGHTQHAFSNPLAHDEQLGTVYNAVAEARSLQAMINFLAELFVN